MKKYRQINYVNVYFFRNDLVYNKTGHVPINATFEVGFHNHYCLGTAMSLTYSECVSVAFVIQHAMRMHHIVLFSVAFPSLSNVCTLSHKGQDFWESLFKLKYLFRFSLHILSEIFFILSRAARDMIINVHTSARKVLVVFVRF